MGAARDAALGKVGALPPSRIRDAIALLLQVRSGRAATWFTAGAAEGFGFGEPGWLPYLPTGRCALWWGLGRLTAALEMPPDRVASLVRSEPDSVAMILQSTPGRPMLAEVLIRTLPIDRDAALGLLECVCVTPAEAVSLGAAVADHAQDLLGQGNADGAHDLCGRFLELLVLEMVDPRPLASPRTEDFRDQTDRLRLTMIRADREMGRWEHGLSHLRQTQEDELSSCARAELHFEWALHELQLTRVGALQPARGNGAGAVVGQLEPVEVRLRTVTHLHPGHQEAFYLLACLALGRGHDAEAYRMFDLVGSSLSVSKEAKPELVDLAAHIDYWRGLLGILVLDEARCSRNVQFLIGALREGASIPPGDLADVLDALIAMNGPGLTEMVEAITQLPGTPILRPGALLEAIQRNPDLVALALDLRGRIAPAQRLAFLGSALEVAGAMARDSVLEDLLDAADDEMTGLGGWREWAHILMSSPNVRAAIDRDGSWVDMCVLEALLRAGLEGGVTDYLRTLACLAANPTRGVDLCPYFEEAEGFVDPQELAGIQAGWQQRMAKHPPKVETPTTTRPRDVRVCFIGGSEPERRELGRARKRLEERGMDWIKVSAVHPGWGSNWPDQAEEAEAYFPNSQVVVLMPLVRTNFGRRIRRSVDEHGLAWFACTGRGAGSMAAAIERAALWAARQAG